MTPKTTLIALQTLWIGAAALSAQPAARPSKEDVVELDRVVVNDRVDGSQGYRVANTTSTGFLPLAVVDTPFSVAAFSSELILDQQARSLLEVTKNDPSISPGGDPLWFDRVNVRGFYLSVNAVFRDGLGINDQGSIALENKESIEVAKGLSALRNGVTSPGGAVNYVVKRAGTQPVSRAAAFADGFGGWGGSVDIGRRFGANNQFGLRVNTAGEEIRSFVDEVKGDRNFVSAAFDWRVNSRLLLEADVERQDRTISSAPSPSLTSFASIAAARTFFPRLDAETRPTQPWAVEPNVQTYLSARATYELAPGWKLRVAGHRAGLDRDQRSVRATNIQPNGDYTASLYFAPDQERNNSAWQAFVNGNFATGTVRHELALGYDYVRRDMIFGDAFSAAIGTGNLFAKPFVADPSPAVGRSYLASRSDQHSFFVADTMRFTDAFHLVGGARLTRLNNFSGNAAGVLTETYDKDALNPTVGIVYKPRAKISLYASYAEGIEQGGTAPNTTVNSGQVMDPLESDQWETGVKFELPRGALLTAAFFQIDKGLEFIDAKTNTYVQDGRQIHEGMEVTVGGPVTPKLRVVAGIAWLDAAVDRTANLALIGKRPQGVPEWQSNLFADYDLSSWIGGLSVNAGVYHAGAKPIDQNNTWEADSYVRVDAGLRYRQTLSETRALVYRFNVENVGDVRYVNDATFGSLIFGSPLAARLSVALEF